MLSTYVHLVEDDLPDAVILDDLVAEPVGNPWATRATEPGRDAGMLVGAETA